MVNSFWKTVRLFCTLGSKALLAGSLTFLAASLFLFDLKAETNCPASYCVPECKGHFYLEIDALLLKPIQESLTRNFDIVKLTEFNEGDQVVSELSGKTVEPPFDWRLGGRLRVGFGFDATRSGFEASWTHLYSKTTGRSHRSASDWRLNFNVTDFTYAREFICPCRFSFIPFGGVRIASIDQKLKQRFISLDLGSPVFSKGFIRQKFLGTGPLIGLEAEQRWYSGFSIYGGLSLGILYGKFHVKAKEEDILSDSFDADKLKKHVNEPQTALDGNLGLKWRGSFNEEILLTIALGLEWHHYFNHSQMYGYGDLALDGLSMNVRLEY